MNPKSRAFKKYGETISTIQNSLLHHQKTMLLNFLNVQVFFFFLDLAALYNQSFDFLPPIQHPESHSLQSQKVNI